MADDKPNWKPPETADDGRPAAQPIVESIPSVRGGISALASANAPFIYFDAVGFYSNTQGVGNFTLAAERPIAALEDGSVGTDRVVTANLRAPLGALVILRNCIDELIKRVAAGEAGVTEPGGSMPTAH